jgi:outer membrane protein
MNSSSASRRPFALRACAVAIVAALGFAGAASAHAEDLMDAYRQALQSDPVLMQAEAQSRIGQAGAAISRSTLLPQLNGSVSFNDSHGTGYESQLIQRPDGGQQFVSGSSSSGGLRSRTESVGLNQVLFDLGRFEQWRSSKANARSTEAQYVAAEQDLILRVATAYFTVLNDQDQLRYAEANQKALQKQLDAAQAKYSVGLSAITDADSARAQEAAAAAAVIQARTTLYNDREALAQITGKAPVDLRVLRDKLPLNPPQPDDPEAWVNTALSTNPSLQAQREQVEAARHDVTAAHAAHLPTLGASVSYSRNPAWGPGNIGAAVDGSHDPVLRDNSRRNDTTVGLVLTVPLVQGGGIIARERQAIAQRDQAQKEAVASAQKALQSTQAGYEVGSQTIIDVLFAQQTLFQAESNYSQARHAYVINQLNLEFAAGTLSVKDLEAVNALLQ